MIFGINTTSDISKLLYIISRAVRLTRSAGTTEALFSHQKEKTVYIKTHKIGHKSAREPHRRDVTHILSKVSCFFFHWNPFIYVGYRNDRFFTHTNPYISNVTQQCRCSPVLIFRAWATCGNIVLIQSFLYFQRSPVTRHRRVTYGM